MPQKHKCDECGDRFWPTTTWQKFCSPACRLKAWRKKKQEARA